MSAFKMPCACNYSLGMGPNLLCPEHGNTHHMAAALKRIQAKVTELGKVCEAGESISAHKETATSSEWESFDEALRAAGYGEGV